MLGTPKHFTVGSNFFMDLDTQTHSLACIFQTVPDQKNKTRLSFARMQGKKLEATIKFLGANDINIALHR